MLSKAWVAEVSGLGAGVFMVGAPGGKAKPAILFFPLNARRGADSFGC